MREILEAASLTAGGVLAEIFHFCETVVVSTSAPAGNGSFV